MKKIILMFILFIFMSNLLFCEGGKMDIILEYANVVWLKDEGYIKKFQFKKEVAFCKGEGYMTKNFYLERPRAGIYPSIDDYVRKEDYDKNPNIILDKKNNVVKDIFIKALPKGTEFELVSVKFDAANLSDCHYWIKLTNDPEYKDILIDAVALTEIDKYYLVSSWWSSFIEEKNINGKIVSTKIKVDKVPMFKRKWAKEIKEKK
jgi:hypothetical protein